MELKVSTGRARAIQASQRKVTRKSFDETLAMNRGLLQGSPAQQMIIAGNPNWWSIINNMRPPPPNHHQQTYSPFMLPPPTHFPQFTPSSSSSPSPSPPSSSSSLPIIPSWHDNQDNKLPESWSQLLLGGLVVVGDEDKTNLHNFQPRTTLDNWDQQQVFHQPSSASLVDVRQENSASSFVYGHANEDFQASWSHLMPASSTKSCVTISSNMLDFSASKGDGRHPPPDRSPECNSSGSGGAPKKARVQPSTTQSTFKVRKEKLGDRITALHQLVSPFGKTDTASVLLEAIGYIRFLQNQIEALSLPYLGNGSTNMRQQQIVQVERNCKFPEDPVQNSHGEPKKDLRSRGLCLVPVACTLGVGSDNGADFWAPTLGGEFR